MIRYGMIFCGCLLFGTVTGFGYDWSTNPGSGEPNTPYQISEPNQLIAIGSNADLLDKCFILINDIIFDPNNNPNHVFTAAVIAPDPDTAGGYQGISFTGCFDGNGYQIVNLYLTNNSYLGLFGMIGSGGQVRDLELKNVLINEGDDYLGGLAGYIQQGEIRNCQLNVHITGRDYLGGMIGYHTGGTISTCNIAGTIECINGSSSSAGGLLGYNTQSVIKDCFAAVNLEGEGIRSGGGLIGMNFESTIRHCSAAGSIIGGAKMENSGIGGLVGRSFGSTIFFCSAFVDVTGDLQAFGNLGGLVGCAGISDYDSTIRFCQAYGDVTGGSYSENVGGLVGYDAAKIEFCSASGNVTGGDHVGGLIGFGLSQFCRFSQCYAEGDVTGTDHVGGFAGTFGSIPFDPPPCCYAIGRVSAAPWAQYVGGFKGQPYSGFVVPDYRCYYLAQEGLTDNFAFPLTEDQLKQQASFIEWDFVGETANGTEDKWRMCEDGVSYPKHAWEYGMYGDFACPEGVASEDLAALMAAWGTHKGDPGFSYACDGNGDGLIDMEDFAILSRHWQAPILSVSQNRAEFFVPYSNPSVQTQTLIIQNTGRSTLDWDLEMLANLPKWLSINPQNGILEPGESQSVTLEADIAGLSIGYYNYIFRVMGASAQYSPQVIVTKLYVSPFAGGSGTPEDPFRIRTPEQLIAAGQDPLLLIKCFKLTRDIDLSGIVFNTAVIASGTLNGLEFCGSPFRGYFDGNGYRIKNLTIHTTDTTKDDFLGLFGQIGIHGLVQNLGLENASILGVTGSHYIGTLAGSNGGGKIRSCYATGTIMGGNKLGGLVGENGGQIDNCYTSVSITGNSLLGGLAGWNICYSPSSTGTIRTCHAAGRLTGNNIKTINGIVIYTPNTVQSCYFLDTIGPSNYYAACPLTDAQMKQQASFVAWDFMGETANGTNEIWWIKEEIGYPRLWWELNEPPVADAGADQVVYSEIDGWAQVQLDGSGSTDLDGDELEYFWYVDVNDLIATGPHPTITLPIGEYMITLVVSDGHVDSDPNDVVITVIGPLEVNLALVPNVIRLTSRRDYITAVLTLPKGALIKDLDKNQPWRLLPGDPEAIFTRTINNHRWQTVFAVFDRQTLLDILDLEKPDSRSHHVRPRCHRSSMEVELTVYSKLITGQIIFGMNTIRIIGLP